MSSSSPDHAQERRHADVRFITRKWAPAMGGMETYCHCLTRELSKSYEVDIIALPGKERWSPLLPFSLLLFAITTSFKTLFRPAARVCHLADMSLWPLGWIARLRHRRTTYVISAHGTDVSFPLRGGFLGGLYGAYLRLGARMMTRMKVIANSAATAQACRMSGYKDVVIVPLATDMQRVEPTLRENGAAARHLLFAGRLIKLKGLSWFIAHVLPLLPEDFTVCVAGSIWDEEEGEAMNHPRVTYLGRLKPDALAHAFADALCVILPNIEVDTHTFEGFGLVAIEAAGAGGVVVASDHGGLREAVLDTVTGFHVKPGDARGWAQKIMEIAQWSKPERDGFCDQASASVDKHYRWNRVASDTATVYFDHA
jgi:glycosyltransferase involved in cell wall biosynthesis